MRSEFIQTYVKIDQANGQNVLAWDVDKLPDEFLEKIIKVDQSLGYQTTKRPELRQILMDAKQKFDKHMGILAKKLMGKETNDKNKQIIKTFADASKSNKKRLEVLKQIIPDGEEEMRNTLNHLLVIDRPCQSLHKKLNRTAKALYH